MVRAENLEKYRLKDLIRTAIGGGAFSTTL